MESGGSSSLKVTALAQQLRLYKPPPSNDIEGEKTGTIFKPKRAAVLICLFEGENGEVALPGGKAEEGDKDDGETAMREAKEEIGLDPSLVNVVTTLEPFLSKLRLYKPPPSVDDDYKDIEKETGKVVAQMGFAESSNPIGRNLEKEREKVQSFKPKRAGVLICLFEGDNGDLRVILTKRSSKLSTHSGEVALPGGKAEEGDKDDGETATREAKEEIGLDPSLVNVVTTLEPFLSKHLLKVVPVIGILSEKEAFKPVPNAGEVEAVFDAPLEMFIKDENRRAEERELMGYKYLIHYFDYETDNKRYLIWGLTAGILIRAASVVYQREPPFLEQNPRFQVLRAVDQDTVIP